MIQRLIKLCICLVVLSGLIFINTNVSMAAPPKAVTEQFLKKVKELAVEGKAINSGKFGVGSHKDDIIASWGTPDEDNNGLIQFIERKISFTVTADGKVDSILTEDERLLQLNQDQINETFGEPFDYDCGVGQCYGLHQVGRFYINCHWNNGIINPGKLLLRNITIHSKNPY